MTEPILTENQAEQEMQKSRSDINAICNYFIDDIKPYVDTDFPKYGSVGSFNSSQFFIPVRVLLGEMCLWSGRYQEAAEYFSQYLREDKPVTQVLQVHKWSVRNLDFALVVPLILHE